MLSGCGLAMDVAHLTWSLLALTALLGGLLAVDETSAFQTWLGQPLPAAILAGIIWGRPEIGLAVGFPLQMVLIGNFPVGRSFLGDPVTATMGTTAAACNAHFTGVAMDGGMSASAMGLWGWLLLGAGLLSLSGHWLVKAERAAFGIWMHEGRLSLRDGDHGRMEKIHLRCLAVTFLRGAVFTLVFMFLVQSLWLRAFHVLGEPVSHALGLLPFVLPGIGVGTLIERFGWKRSWWWVALGVVGGMVMIQVWG